MQKRTELSIRQTNRKKGTAFSIILKCQCSWNISECLLWLLNPNTVNSMPAPQTSHTSAGSLGTMPKTITMTNTRSDETLSFASEAANLYTRQDWKCMAGNSWLTCMENQTEHDNLEHCQPPWQRCLNTLKLTLRALRCMALMKAHEAY